jgi:predicted phosphate transport protein (TIGR00153 family)
MLGSFGKRKKLLDLVGRYLEDLQLARDSFHTALTTALDESDRQKFADLRDTTHKFESAADDVLEEINTLMYEKILLPELRGDIIDLLETMDQVPRFFELTLDLIKTQKLAIPEFAVADIRELLEVSMESCVLMTEQVGDLFEKGTRIRELVDVIDAIESHGDRIERRLITGIFESDIDPFAKLQLKELVITLGSISDQTDRVSKRANIINLKRRV